MEFVIEPDSERPLPLTVWYPALNPDGVAEEITYVYDNFVSIEGFTEPGRAISDAPADTDGGPYPLVIFSHGSVEYRYAYAYLTEHLASHGFVVMAVDHTGNTIAYSVDPEVMGENIEGWAEGFVTTAVYRPADIQRTIDYAASLTGEGQDLAGMIDLEHIGGNRAFVWRLHGAGFDWRSGERQPAARVVRGSRSRPGSPERYGLRHVLRALCRVRGPDPGDARQHIAAGRVVAPV